MTTTASPPEALRLDGVGHTYRATRGSVTALTDISFAIAPGELAVVVGPSGSGKSSLLRLIAGFANPTHGEIRVAGRPVRGPGPDRGVVFQQPRLFPWLSVRGNVEFGLRHLARPARRERALAQLELVGLADVADLRPYELSGGMQQRAAIARALAPAPDVLLLDEPFAALDALTRERMQEELRRVWQVTGTTIILVTHSVDEAAFLGTRIIALSARPGRIALDIASTVPHSPDPHADPAFAEVRHQALTVVRQAAADA